MILLHQKHTSIFAVLLILRTTRLSMSAKQWERKQFLNLFGTFFSKHLVMLWPLKMDVTRRFFYSISTVYRYFGGVHKHSNVFWKESCIWNQKYFTEMCHNAFSTRFTEKIKHTLAKCAVKKRKPENKLAQC